MRTARHLALVLISVVLLAGCGADEPATGDAALDVEGNEFAPPDSPVEDTEVTLDRPDLPEGSKAAELQDQGEIVVGTRFDLPLFGLVNPETDVKEGFDIAMANIIAEAIFGDAGPQRIGFIRAEPGNRADLLTDGTVDIVIAAYPLTFDEDRGVPLLDEGVSFAGPYYSGEQDVLVAADSGVATPEDLARLRVCTGEDTIYAENLRQAVPDADIAITSRDPRECAAALADGRVDAVTHVEAVLMYLAQESDGASAVAGVPLGDVAFGIGVLDEQDEWNDFVGQTLQQAFASDAWAEAYVDTFSPIGVTQAPPPPEPLGPGTG